MTDASNETLDLRRYLRPLRARWWIVVLIAVAAAGFTYEYYSRKPMSYSATTTLLLEPDIAVANSVDRDRTAREQAVIIGTRAIARLVAEELGVANDPRGLPGRVVARPATGTSFLALTSRSADPRSAVELVNSYARVYIRYSGDAGRQAARSARVAAERQLSRIPDLPKNRLVRLQLESTIQTLGLQENSGTSTVQQIEPALSARAIRPSPRRNALFALVLGGLLGIGLAYALEHLDRRVRLLEEVGDLYDSPVLVAVPGAPGAAKALRLQLTLEPPLKEAFRTLRTTLQLHATDASPHGDVAPLRTLLVTSAIAGEGKSTVARSLAIAYYEAGLRVALVDADLRRPTLAESFKLDTEPGFTDVLRGVDVADALRVVWRDADGHPIAAAAAHDLQRQAIGAGAGAAGASALSLAEPRRPAGQPAPGAEGISQSHRGGGQDEDIAATFSVLTSGRPPRDPAALLAGGQIDEVLRRLQADHDIVIVDTSPLLPVSDAVPLLASVDGVLVVSRIGVTTTHAVTQLTELLDRVPRVNVLGVVANDVRQQQGYGYGGYAARGS